MHQSSDSASRLRSFINHEATGGFALCIAAILAMLLVNLGLADTYFSLLEERVRIGIGALTLDKSLHHFINDGLMVIFFFLVGLEIKRETIEGNLSSSAQLVLPICAALGGIIAPSLIYAAINWNHPDTLRGWAIPAATDIAFALGALAVLGNRVPLALKVFLLTLATIDDIASIVIIGLFYPTGLSLLALAGAASVFVVLLACNLLRVTRVAVYVLAGLVMWLFVLKSGVHATLAGILLGLLIPMYRADGSSPVTELEHGLHPYVKWLILPLFAFANAGLPISGITFEKLSEPLSLGIILGLAVGKPVGIMLTVLATVGFGFAKLPEQTNWRYMLGASCLAGIGFTMSLFIGSLAFPEGDIQYGVRAGVIIGSLISMALGIVIMWKGKFERAA